MTEWDDDLDLDAGLEPCADCGGTGIDDEFGEPCEWCGGRGVIRP